MRVHRLGRWVRRRPRVSVYACKNSQAVGRRSSYSSSPNQQSPFCLITVPPNFDFDGRKLVDDRDAPQPGTVKTTEEPNKKVDDEPAAALPIQGKEQAKDGGGCYNCKCL